ncbi:MAG: hypothetical protein QOE61_3723 [Micromonosporaceae bacterium]|nr:hypothetical protein [Micromonosporaceae bacterium]
MTDRENDIDLTAALSQLRTEVRRRVPQPPATQLRRRAEHRLRVRRTATALVAAVVVGAVLIGGGLNWGSAVPNPPTPGGTGNPTPTDSSSPRSRPSKPVPPRHTPQVQDAIGSTNWEQATITLPTHPGCPSGSVSFRKQQFKGGDAVIGPNSWPRMTFDAQSLVYGDLTGDGQPEAVLYASCWLTEQDSGDGQGQLLVVRREGGTLRGIGWVGPRGALFADRWVENGRLNLDVKPWHQNWGYLLGADQSYRWTGQEFTQVEDSSHPGLVPRVGGLAPVVDLGPVAGLTGCPAAALRFGADGRTTAAGTNWDLVQPSAPDDEQHLVDLNGDGKRWLLAAITCGRRADGSVPDIGTGFLAVIERRPDGSFRAIDAVRPPTGMFVAGWRYQAGSLTLEFGRVNETPQDRRYTWNGEYFQE